MNGEEKLDRKPNLKDWYDQLRWGILLRYEEYLGNFLKMWILLNGKYNWIDYKQCKIMWCYLTCSANLMDFKGSDVDAVQKDLWKRKWKSKAPLKIWTTKAFLIF